MSKESDMYGFGVVVLEIACGRKTYQDGEHNHVPLVNWVWKHYVEENILNVAEGRPCTNRLFPTPSKRSL